MAEHFADVSEWQRGVDDTYPHRIISIRSNDGTYRDKRWAHNYDWCRRRADQNALDCFIVYLVYRPNWQATLDTLKSNVGVPHPKMIVMVDVEVWGGQISGNQSSGINALIDGIAGWLGDRRRVIAYLNTNESGHIWPQRPPIKYVIPSYGAPPRFAAGFEDVRDNMIAWQYTDEKGFPGGPSGAAPFGNCDMNRTELSVREFAALCGIGGSFLMALNDGQQNQVWAGAAQWSEPQKEGPKSIGPRPQKFPDRYNVSGGRTDGGGEAWGRAMLMDLWNEIVFDNYAPACDDPFFQNPDQPRSLVAYVLRTHALIYELSKKVK